jgi:hypothetical protein
MTVTDALLAGASPDEINRSTVPQERRRDRGGRRRLAEQGRGDTAARIGEDKLLPLLGSSPGICGR